jgi:hypothetical protein
MIEISLLEFYAKYCKVNGKEPTITDKDKWLLENLESGNIQRVWTRKYGWQYKQLNQNKEDEC